MEKVDLKKDLKHLYTASAQAISLVEVPRLHFLMLDGAGDPNTAPRFQEAVETLFSLSYTLKFLFKKTQGLDWTVMPLEGLWNADDLTCFATGNKDAWKWTLMILQPDAVTRGALDLAISEIAKKKKLPLVSEVRLSALGEGQAAQILHVGPFSDEHLTIARLHAFIKDKGFHFAGPHHEIYLSDPRRTAPEKLKTILRQPITLEAQR